MEAAESAPEIQKQMEEKLRSNLKIEYLAGSAEFTDTSGNCGSAFAVTIVSPNFAKMLTLQRHKLVNQILKDEIPQLHAFSQKTLLPEQWEKEKSK
nr:hypothetical protein L204_04517 [Cryptococcus depauperatus CBS 7855]